MKNKIISATTSALLLSIFTYGFISGTILEMSAWTVAGIFISAIFYLIYESTLEWLNDRDARNKATEANKRYFDKIRNMKNKPPRK